MGVLISGPKPPKQSRLTERKHIFLIEAFNLFKYVETCVTNWGFCQLSCCIKGNVESSVFGASVQTCYQYNVPKCVCRGVCLCSLPAVKSLGSHCVSLQCLSDSCLPLRRVLGETCMVHIKWMYLCDNGAESLLDNVAK